MAKIPDTSAKSESEVVASWLAPETLELVWFGGADAEKFLNDLVSQEITGMADGETRRSLLLQPRGKLDFILWVIRSGDRFGLATQAGRGDDLVSTLTRFRIRVDVTIERETGDSWLVMGEYQPGDGLSFDVSWPTIRRTLVLGDRPDLPIGTIDEYEAARIAAGEPRWGVDVDDESMPHETGLVRASVDFDKGCFLGQELVARVQSRGANSPRHLSILDLAGSSATGVTVTSLEGKEVGRLTSVVEGLGLAMLHREVSPGDQVLVGDVEAVARDLPSNQQT